MFQRNCINSRLFYYDGDLADITFLTIKRLLFLPQADDLDGLRLKILPTETVRRFTGPSNRIDRSAV